MKRALVLFSALAFACTPPKTDYTGKKCDVSCPSGWRCNQDGVCEKGASCEAPTAACGGRCVDVTQDPRNCGACGKACPLPTNAESAGCNQSHCTLGACRAGYADCDEDAATGCEVNTESDLGNCGACRHPCNLPHAIALCQNGGCAIATCAAGYQDCDGDPDNGCESNTATDPDHCGDCKATPCPPATNAIPACKASACAIECNLGFADCDGDPGTGCEVALASDPTHCGSCGAPACESGPQSVAACSQGKCKLTCDAGFADCDTTASTGCETATTADPAHCGGCAPCALPHTATDTCTAGVCGIGTCSSGFMDCDFVTSNGCETNINGDPLHCGGCAPCQLPHVQIHTCVSGGCGIGLCDPGYASCNPVVTDGCETKVSDDPLHCGLCTKVCSGAPHADPSCVNSSCGLTCQTGFADGDGNPANGCEACVPTNGGVEICDGLDNDCNGAIDDALGACCVSTVTSAGLPSAQAGMILGEASALWVADPLKGLTRVDLQTYQVSSLFTSGMAAMDLVKDGAGGLFVVSSNGNRVYALTPSGGSFSSAPAAGNGTASCVDAATALAASYRGPVGVVLLPTGHLVLADDLNHRLADVVPKGAGNGSSASFASTCAAGAGAASGSPVTLANARFNQPHGLAYDPAGTGTVWVADAFNKAIRKIDVASGTVSTIGGLSVSPSHLALDAAKNVWFTAGNQVFKIAAGGATATLVTGLAGPGNADGACASAAFSSAAGIVADGSGTATVLYVLDSGNAAIRRIASLP
jgi:streptogramin lyase